MGVSALLGCRAYIAIGINVYALMSMARQPKSTITTILHTTHRLECYCQNSAFDNDVFTEVLWEGGPCIGLPSV